MEIMKKFMFRDKGRTSGFAAKDRRMLRVVRTLLIIKQTVEKLRNN